MRSFSALFLVFLYTLAMARPIFPVLDYIINQDYIAEFLCVNKEKVALHCNGKCYLMQKLNKQNDEKRQNLPKIAMEDYPIGFVRLVSIDFQKDKIEPSPTFARYCNYYSFIFSDSSFRPPGITS